MANLVDLYVVYRILRRLTQPFTEWEAFKLGVIDAEGNILKKGDDRRTIAEKDSLTTFDVLMIKLKKLLAMVPGGRTRIASYAAALWLIKEEKNLTEENFEEEFRKHRLNEKFTKKLNEARVDKHELAGYVVIDGYVFKDAGKSGRSTYGRYTIKDPDYVKDPKEVGMHRNYRKPDFLSFSTLADAKKWVKTQPKKSASEIEAVHKKFSEREQMYNEEAPANAVGGGNIAGTGDDPPVGKKAQMALVRRAKFANNDVFVVDTERFNKARLGKKKYLKYETYVGNDEIGNEIRQFGRKYPKKPIILQDDKTGAMIFLRYGRSGMFTESFLFEEAEITQSDLKKIEDYADKLFKALDIDVQFTKHFLDRVNDARNIKQITPDELTALFRKTYHTHGKKITKLGPDAEAVIADMASNVNMPFVLNWDRNNQELDLVAKTVMRKKNFMTSNPKLKV